MVKSALIGVLTLLAAVTAVLCLATNAPAPTCTGAIGDFVWNDVNRNGVQDDGEPGINGVVVELKNSSGTVIAMTTTGAGPSGQNGYYQFTGLCAGTYEVEVPAVLPDGKGLTIANAPGSTPANDSNANPALVTLPANNSSDQTIDFGYVSPCTGAIGDFVWHDQNGNGLQDAGEPGINGVMVELLDAASTVIATTTTSSNGFYQFSGLCAGTYFVRSATPVGFSPTSPCGADQTMPDDSNCSPAQVDLSADDVSNETIDFGFVKKVVAPGTGTPGYWKNHPEAWPVNSIAIGGVTYTKFAAIAIMKRPVKGDKTYTMFDALVAAKLNVLIGNDASCISATIAAADAWMVTYGPVGSGVAASSGAWNMGEPLYMRLDAYNNGLLCAPHRD